MDSEYVIDWVLHNIRLCDFRLTRALADMAWALAVSGKVSFTEIGAAIEGRATPASNHKRVSRFCNNERVKPAAVQEALVRLLVGDALSRSKAHGPSLVTVAMDWTNYDNGEVCGLRISLITGSRALPLLWYEIPKVELKGRQTAMECKAIADLESFRPPHVTWLFLLDCGFHAPQVLDALNRTGYFIVRSQTHPLVHLPKNCWQPVGSLPVKLESLVEFGWVTWSQKTPRTVRLVVARMPPIKQRNRRAARAGTKHVQPGYCPLLTNLPEGEAIAEDVLRIYGRRFEIEHGFRDIVSSTRGLDLEHVHLKNAETYSRLLCIVALTEAILWLCGAEAERMGLKKAYSSSRPKSDRRVLSLVRLGRKAIREIRRPLHKLVRCHLRTALEIVLAITGHTWRAPKRAYRLDNLAEAPRALPRLGSRCRRKNKGDRPFAPCVQAAVQLRPAREGGATLAERRAA